MADAIGTEHALLRSLEVASTGNANHCYSFRAGNVLNPAETSPAALYARIFGPEFKDPNAAEFVPDPEVMARQSVLSGVREQRARSWRNIWAPPDRARIDGVLHVRAPGGAAVRPSIAEAGAAGGRLLEIRSSAEERSPPGTEIETVTP